MFRRPVGGRLILKLVQPLLAVAMAILPHVGAASAESMVRQPDCAVLESWAARIDGKDRWQPIEGKRAWIPRAFQTPAFETTFGVPAMAWSSKDAEAMAAHLYDCGQLAGKERRMDARKALYGARGYMQGNLRAVLLLQERLAQVEQQNDEREAARRKEAAEQRQQEAAAARARAEKREQEQDAELAQALDALLAEPSSPDLLRSLAMLRAANFDDPESYGHVYGRVGSAGRKLMFVLRNQQSDMKDPRVAPKLEARYESLRDEVVTSYRSNVDDLNNSTDSLRLLGRWQQEVAQQLAHLLGREATDGLLQAMAEKDQSIRAGIFGRAKLLIDQAEDNTQSAADALTLIDKIVANSASAGLTSAQLEEVRSYARQRKGPLADRILDGEMAKLGSYPETLDGLDALARILAGIERGPKRFATKEKAAAYAEASRARLTSIAAAALAEFERNLADLPESPEGLAMTETTVVSVDGFGAVGDHVRKRYLAAIDERRMAISEALEAKAAERRRAALDAGADPDIVGFRFVDSQHASQLEFRDETLVIIAIMGMRTAGDYQVSENDVIVRGPNGTLVLARSGSGESMKLSGMGLTFRRVVD